MAGLPPLVLSLLLPLREIVGFVAGSVGRDFGARCLWIPRLSTVQCAILCGSRAESPVFAMWEVSGHALIKNNNTALPGG